MFKNLFKTRILLVAAGILFVCFVTGGILYVSFDTGFVEILQVNGLDSKFFAYLIFTMSLVCGCLIFFCSDKVLRYVLLIGALYYIFIYLVLVFYRIGYPFELEWMEGGSVDHVIRILSGQKLYVTPSLEFIPYLYTPFYFYLSAAVSKMMGVGFMPLRVVSVTSSLGCFFMIFAIVRRETGNAFWGIISACLFAATFRVSGAWFDIARVDSLFLFLLLLAVYVLRFHSSIQSYILAGFLISLSFYTKQTALIPAVFLMIYVLTVKRNNAFYFIGTIFLLMGVGDLLLNNIHQGYFNYYIFYLQMQHEFVTEMLVNFWTKDILLHLFIACGFVGFYFMYSLTNLDKNIICIYMLIAVSMMLSSWVSRLHWGGYDNVLFPAYAIIAILFGLGAHSLMGVINITFVNDRSLMLKVVYSLCILQFGFLFYNPGKQIPNSQDLQAGKRFLEIIRGIKGDVYVPFHAYLGVLAGKRSYAHEMSSEDVLRGNKGVEPDKERLFTEIKESIRLHKFSAIILDRADWYDIGKYYHIEKLLFEYSYAFYPVTGFETRPSFVFFPDRVLPGDKLLFDNSDFERGDLRNWTAQGNAFLKQPTLGNNSFYRGRGMNNLLGKYWIGTYEDHHTTNQPWGTIQGDGPTGKLVSIPFIIERNNISFMIGAGDSSPNEGVALEVQGQEVLVERGWGKDMDSEKMSWVVWDVSKWRGKQARLIIRDNSSGVWGHINVDDFRYL